MSKTGKKLFQMVLFASFGTLMFISDLLMEALPNLHLIAMFTVTFTVVYRVKALIPLYVYILITLFYSGFATWSLPYLYIWTVLWAVVMLLPKKMPAFIAAPVYMAVSGLHGILFGLLYAPAHILLFFGGDWSKLWPWVVAGLPFDTIHCIGNIISGILILPLITALRKMPYAKSEK